MRIIIIVFLVLLYSCKVSSKSDITIYPFINKQDSILILNVKNNTNSDLMIEFPVLNNFYYKDELDASTSEIIYTKQSFNLLGDTMDANLKKNLKCKAFQDLMEIPNDSGLKFINKNSTKKYYLKITRYRRGKTLLLKDDNFNFVYKLLDGDRKKLVPDIKNQSCGNYRYFTGDSEFILKEITIP